MLRVRDGSERKTPYMVGNHMIAAGVTGRCTGDPSKMPDIRLYEAQDLVAATFLRSYLEEPDQNPAAAKARACMRWFGNEEGNGPPEPPKKEDRETICALAQMDLYFCPGPPPHPKYTLEEARERCRKKSKKANPCGKRLGPKDEN